MNSSILTPGLVVFIVIWTGFCLDSSLDERWEKFKRQHNKTYSGNTEEFRRGIWESKIRMIEKHNNETENGNHTYWLQETPWDDLTYKEFMYNDTDFNETDYFGIWGGNSCECYNCTSTSSDLPESIDWTEKGYVTEVKDQGRCGACWAFSVVGTLEGQLYRKTKKLISLSPQSLVDCDTVSKGCGGGNMRSALRFVRQHGIASEADYPYTESDNKCKLSEAGVSAKITCYGKIWTEDQLLRALAKIGPISVGISTGPMIQNLGKGVFNDCTGPSNHAVVLVGYGVHDGKKVWKIKNSYSESWGTKGYFFMSRECRNACGIVNTATYPFMDDIIPEKKTRDTVFGTLHCGAVSQEISSLILRLAVLRALMIFIQ